MTCADCGNGFPPVRVHVEHVEAGAAAAIASASSPGPAPRKARRATVITKVCTSTAPVQTIAGLDERRLYLRIRALDHDVVLCTELGQAQDPANVASGQPNPNGAVIPSADTYSEAIEHGGTLYVVAATYPARVSVLIVHEEG